MIGQTISHYRILEKLGEGGMGVVYKAQDTKLDRSVALKFLPEHVSASSGDLERFKQEAKAAAALNHPNICTIHGIEEAEGKNFIVMEFVDGQMLQEKKSSLSMKQALDIGIQIAEGLAAAHEKGIVHRDIKPENIMIRKDGRVQVMDFGLAKLRGASRLTKEGSTVGTAGYMSPEQVQGQETDHRSDIFSLGVLLYEMLSGQPPFKGIHETAVSYEIVNVDSPPMSSIKVEIPPELDAIVLDCLEKDPKERTQAASQVALELKRYRRESSKQRASRITAARPVQSSAGILSPEPSQRSSPSWTLAGAIALGAMIFGFALSFFIPETKSLGPVVRASIDMPPGIQYSETVGGNSAISPDGSMIVYSGIDSAGKRLLRVRRLDAEDLKVLSGTDNAGYPFWSYDSKSIGFFQEGKLRTIPASGGPVVTLADAPFGRGAAWSSNGTIIFSPSILEPNLLGVNSGGGGVHPVTRFDTSRGAVPRFPSFLPDGDHFLFSMLTTLTNHSEIHVGSLETGESKRILDEGSNPVYASGYLLFHRQGILMAQQFDPGAASLSGRPVPLQGNLNAWLARAKADFSSSTTGIILHASGSSEQKTEFVWINQSGTIEPIMETGLFSVPSLSFDGNRIAFGQSLSEGGVDIWTYDIQRKVRTRLTFIAPNSAATMPAWSRDGRMIYYNSEQKGGKASIFARRSDGAGSEELIAQGSAGITSGYYPTDVSPDGRYLLFNISNESASELGILDLTDTKRPIQPSPAGIDGRQGHFSPDGRWVVYQAGNVSEQRVLVSQFGGGKSTWQVTSSSGINPMWAGSRIIYYSTTESQYMQVGVSVTAGSPTFDPPKPLFPRQGASNVFIHGYSTARKKYFGVRPTNASSNGRLSLIINWPQLMKVE